MGCIGLVGSFVIIKPMNIFYFNQSEVSILPNLGGRWVKGQNGGFNFSQTLHFEKFKLRRCTKPTIPNQTYQTKPSKQNLLNQTFKSHKFKCVNKIYRSKSNKSIKT